MKKFWRLGVPEFHEVTGKHFGTADDFYDYDQKILAEYPIRQKILRFCWDVKIRVTHHYENVRGWFRIRLNPKRYDMTRLRLKRLERGYYDPDTVILYAAFETFEDYMKPQIEGRGHTDWDLEHNEETDYVLGSDGVDARLQAWADMKKLYDWWVNVRPNRENTLPPFPELPRRKGALSFLSERFKDDPEIVEWKRIADIHNEAERQWAIEDDDMLALLVKHRRYFWD